MKNFLKIFAAFLFISLCTAPSYAHKEWVHQWIIKEAYKLLKAETGQTFPDLEQFLGKDDFEDGQSTGPCDAFNAQRYPDLWTSTYSNSIVTGAWSEDQFDLRWNIGGPFNGWDPSSTHFWESNAGDDALALIHNDWVGNQPNAYTKARYFLFGTDFNPDFNFQIGAPPDGGPYCKKKFIKYPSEGSFLLNSFQTSYPNLKSVYENGDVRYILGSWLFNARLDEPYGLDGDGRKRYAYNIIGHILHLLADMSVPAHVHNDTHPCDLHIGFDYSDGDTYELFMGDNDGTSGTSSCNTEHPNPYQCAHYWPYLRCREQGGLLWEVFSMTDEDMFKYLFYTTNRLAAHFSSRSAVGGHEMTSGNHSLSNGTTGTVSTPYITWRYSILGDPYYDLDATSQEVLRYCIRATATLLYWFEVKVGQVPCTEVLHLQSDDFLGIDDNFHNVSTPTMVRASFEASQDIIAGRNIYPHQTEGDLAPNDYVVHSGALLDLKAFNSIQFEDGVDLNSGADVHALITNSPSCSVIKSSSHEVDKNISFKTSARSTPKSIDTSVNRLVIYIDTNASMSGSISDTLHISPYMWALWNRANIHELAVDSVQASIFDAGTKLTLRIDTLRIYIPIDTLIDSLVEQAIDTSLIAEISGDGDIIIFSNNSEKVGYLPNMNSEPELSPSLELYPNPVSSISTIRYSLPYQSMVTLEVFDILGQSQSVIVGNEFQKNGSYAVTYDFSKFPSGTYFLRLRYSGKTSTLKIIRE